MRNAIGFIRQQSLTTLTSLTDDTATPASTAARATSLTDYTPPGLAVLRGSAQGPTGDLLWSSLIQPKHPTPAKPDVDNATDQIKNKLDSLSEMGETESLRLQMAMDRLSKMMSTLSNLLKKVSDTDSGIVSNIK